MLLWKHFQEQRGVYMTMGRISRRREFTPVPSRGSVFVYMIPSPRYLTRVNPSVVKRATTKCRAGASSHRCEFTPVVAPEREFHSGKKFRNVINM